MGVFERLARGARDRGAGGASDIGAHAEGTMLLLESLAALDQVERERGTYSLSRAGRKWLDPASDTYIGTHIENCLDYWDWWARLEDVIRTGKGVEIHDFAPGRPALAPVHPRPVRAGPAVGARGGGRPAPPARPAAAAGRGRRPRLVRRRAVPPSPELQATVLDLPASAAVGREIIAEQGMADRVHPRRGGHDECATSAAPTTARCASTSCTTCRRSRTSRCCAASTMRLSPGGTVAVLDLFMPPPDTRADAGAMLGLFFYLTSSAATYTEDQLRDWLAQAGFDRPRRIKLRRLPNLALFEAAEAD